jgi:ADP-heptose:LPS heptosyltransferase
MLLHRCKNVLCIRLDNMGDVIMSSPAIRGIKETWNCRVTLLTSSMGALVTGLVPGIDDVLVFDVPWVKLNGDADEITAMGATLRSLNFDAAIIFTVFSQSPLPAAMLAFMAGIPVRAAYCRENPYQLLTHWVPELEPYSVVMHQVQRDINLVEALGARVAEDTLELLSDRDAALRLKKKLHAAGIHESGRMIILHPGVSEKKREYPLERWMETCIGLQKLQHHIIVTGSVSEQELAEKLCAAIGPHCVNLAGQILVNEFVELIRMASLLISVNTSAIHIAAATRTPMIVLYALTNPQHTPWKGRGVVLPFEVPVGLRSRNQVLAFVAEKYFSQHIPPVMPEDIIAAALSLLRSNDVSEIPALVSLGNAVAPPVP